MQQDLIIYASALVGALGVLFGAIYSIYRIAKRIGDALGVDKKGRTISERLDRVEHQLWENGGSSLADRVNNIEMHVLKVSTEIEIIKDITLGMQTTKAARARQKNIKKESE